MAGNSPDPGKVARDVAGAMVASEPVEPIGWATARQADGTPIYMVVVVMGSENCNKIDKCLEKAKAYLQPPVDIFSGTPGEPVEVAG